MKALCINMRQISDSSVKDNDNDNNAFIPPSNKTPDETRIMIIIQVLCE